ncbi:aldo/keto reductase [Sphaerochaeta sp. S2]|uniref:aldo/keto reductase n=1 Tax=Sphaerochaeta sp. S2 TaxID=2798868 RepID=UPI0018E958CA|nr:aldo/keto reductase [Sphaerochaeta sp. S2]MBJ2355128.1 aldo/keto reductase [Sphaerochaeta sp. S2]MDY0243259.1 aldo/keto reductase [Sphaerochaeta sp.]
MKKRPFGTNKTMVSEVGLGTWQIGGSWGTVEDETAMKILQTASDAGITFFDTADVYGDGRSEKFIGKFLKSQRDSFFVATKLGRGGDPGWPGNFTPEAMIRHTDASLSRLGVERLDLIQLHCIPQDVLADGAVFDVLRDLKKQGKIADFGASVESVEEGLICLKEEGIASLQVIFNIFRQKLITDLFSKAKEKEVSIIARVPLASGLLSGKMTKNTTFDESDHRNFNRDGASFNVGETFAGVPFEKGVELAEEIKTMKPEGMTLAQMALRWILDFDAVSVVIPGASRPSQVLDNAAISDLPPLSDELHKQLEKFYQEKVAQHIRGPY